MKKIYILTVLFSLVLLGGCSKDFLKRYDSRIVGTWRISDVSRIGFGPSADKLPFSSGNFEFREDGSLTYTNSANITYQGRWDIVKRIRNDETVRRLEISAVDFTTQEIISEYYDDMNFVGTNHFNAQIVSNFNTYVTHFRR